MVETARPAHPLDTLRAHPTLVAWALVALGSGLLRFIVLDRVPLTSGEARYALPAWQAVLGQLDESLVDGGAPLLSHTLVALFGLFGASDLAARLLPALAGVGLTLTPALLTNTLGLRTTLWAGLLIAISPLAIQTSRVLDPASLTAALAMLVVCSAIRLSTDRPPWAPWTLALGAGLSLAHSSGALLALAGAGVAALVIFARTGENRLGDWRRWIPASLDGWEPARAWAGPAGLFLGAVLLVATAGLTDLRGIGFVVADIWTGAVGLLAPDAFPTRGIISILAYGGPLLTLALGGYLLASRDMRPPRPPERRRGRHAETDERDLLQIEALRITRGHRFRLIVFFSLWTLILLVMAAVAGGDKLTFAVLPVAPAAVLAATALARLSLDPRDHELSMDGWALLLLAAVLGVAAIVIFSQTVAAGRPAPIVAWVFLIGLLVLLASGWRNVGGSERITAGVALGAIAFLVLTATAASRASFGGSPPGTELLVREETAPAFRSMFRQLNVLASANPSRVLVIDLPETSVARWYGRAIPSRSAAAPGSPGAWFMREAPPAQGSGPTEIVRVPWKTTSEIDTADVYPLGILRWLVTRSTLVQPKPHDIILTQ